MRLLKTFTAAATSGLLAACMHAPPAPISLDAKVTEAAATGFGREKVAQIARAMAGAAPVAVDAPDRLSLLAALILYDPRIAQAQKALAVAQREALSARKVGAPSFSLTGQYSNDPTTEPWQGSIGASLPLDYGGVRAARLTRADVAVLIARDDLAETIWAERMAARASLMDGLIAKRRAILLTQQVAIREHILQAVDARLAAGEGTAMERDAARIALRQSQRALEDTRWLMADARARLAATLGLSQAALAGVDFRWDDFADPAPDAPAPDAGLAHRAVVSRADVLRSVAAYDQSEADLRGELARQYPQVTLQPSMTWAGGPMTVPFGLGLSMPSWDGNRATIRTALARRDAAGAAIHTAVATALGAIDTAAQESRAARVALDHVRKGEWPAALSAARRAEQRRAAGETGRIEAMTMQAGVLDAELTLLEALGRVQKADAALEDALRRPLSGPETRIDLLNLAQIPRSSATPVAAQSPEMK
jgi:cobalt-zinc-cadmium efflux system outer membrane protein